MKKLDWTIFQVTYWAACDEGAGAAAAGGATFSPGPWNRRQSPKT